MYEIYIVQGQGGGTQQHKQTNFKKNTHKHALPPGLCGDNLTPHLMKVSSEGYRLSIANHLASTDNLTKTTNTYEHEHTAEYYNRQRILTMRRYTVNTHKKILG